MTAGAGRVTGQRPAPLCVHVLFHPSSGVAKGLASHLLTVLNGPSTDFGARIPVQFSPATDDGHPVPPKLDAERSLVVFLVDKRMARGATPADLACANAWADLLDDLLTTYPPGTPNPCSVLPVAVDAAALRLSDRLDQRSFVRLDAKDRQHLDLHVTIGCLRLMAGRPASDGSEVDHLPPSDVSLFVSHAKRDLRHETWRGPVAALEAAHRDLPLQKWYDSRDIAVGSTFSEEITRAIERVTAVVVVLTDNYSSREWCRREILAAKLADKPLVVVDAIESQVVRLFPYIGNATTVRWRAALAEATSAEGQEPPGRRERWESEDAAVVLLVTLLEALRHRHEYARLESTADGADVVLGTHPELVTITATPAGSDRVLYPDPPLGREELAMAQRARPRLELVTPLERLTRGLPPSGMDAVALSLSGSPDAHRYGGTPLHLATMAHDLALYLLAGGVRLVYGGVLGHGAVGVDGRAPGDEVNYVERLLELVERHWPAAEEGSRAWQPIMNWLAWPMYEEQSDDDRDRYLKDRIAVVDMPRPAGLHLDELGFRRGADGRYPANSPQARYVRARCLTAMREASTAYSAARIAIGGKLEGYAGIVPGVAEEAMLTLRAGKPLYLLGAFGGAARAVIDLLRGRERVELTNDWCSSHSSTWTDVVSVARDQEDEVLLPERLAGELRDRGRDGLHSALRNGLSERENDELVATTDARRAVELVLGGLHSIGAGG